MITEKKGIFYYMALSISEITQLWDRCLRKIEEQFDKQAFDSFFVGSYVYDITENTMLVVVKSPFVVAVIKTKYLDLVAEIVNEVFGHDYSLEFVDKDGVDAYKSERIVSTSSNQKKNEYFDNIVLNNKLTFDNYVVGDFNKEAYQAAAMVSSKPGTMFNPLFIHSESGLGKTHLLHAIGNYIKTKVNPDAKVLYIDGNEFVEAYLSFIRGDKEAQTMKDYFMTVDVLLIDDIQLLANKVKTQEAFFVVYQVMVNRGKQIVITSDKQPSELSGLENRLITRFSQGLVVKINEPDQNTCVNILRKKIIENGLDLNRFDDNVLYFFADKFRKNVRELEGALNRLIFTMAGLKENEMINMDVAVNAVSSLVDGKQLVTQISEQKIINTVADYYNLLPSQLIGKTRTGQIALARHIAMYLIRNMLDVPLKKIGDMFGGKDHTTVMSAITKVDKELKTDATLKEAVSELQNRLKA